MDGLLTLRRMFVAMGFIFILNKVMGDSTKFNCTGDWKSIHRGCYMFVQTKKTWDDAKASCQQDGGDLTSITSRSEKKKLLKELNQLKARLLPKLQKQVSTDEHFMWWVGLRRGQGPWTWEDGTQFSDRVTRWGPGEPNNKRKMEDCVEMKYDGYLNDKNCDQLRPFICEKHEITKRPPLLTPTSPVRTSTFKTTPVKNLATTTEQHTTLTTSTPKPPTTTTQVKTTTTTTAKTTLKTTLVTTLKTTLSTRGAETSPPRTTISILTSTTWEESLSPFLGCYQIGEGSSSDLRHSGASSNYVNYDAAARNCPAVHAFNLNWPETPVGTFANATCRGGSGKATWRCWSKPTCWRGEPNLVECASKKFKNLLKKVKDAHGPTPSPQEQDEQDVEVSSILAEATESEDVSVEDLMVTTTVFSSLSATDAKSDTPKDEQMVTDIVTNVVKAGSNLVSEKMDDTWSEMKSEDKVRSASALLSSMEKVTTQMADNLDKPTVISTQDENIVLQIQVVDVTSSDAKELVYNEDSSENSVSIPIASLRSASKGGLAKAVFMTHHKMADLLEHSDTYSKKDNTKPNKIASSILSITLGTGPIQLPEPVTFVMKLVKRLPPKTIALCSFWDLTDYPGSWSQRGCHLHDVNISHVTCQCDHLTNFAILMDVEGVKIHVVHSAILRFITLVGCVISIICLFFSWVTFQCFGSIQGERNTIHKNLVVCLFIAEMLFVTGIDRTQNQLACGMIAAFLHYFFLCMFTWMLIEGLHMVFMLTQVFDAAKSRLPYYYMSAYGAPAAVVAISAGAYYQGYGTETYCWLTTERYFIWSFAGPVAVILLVNAIILTYAMSMVCRHSEYVMNTKEKDSANFRTWVQGALSMEVLLGLTWVFGYFYISKAAVALAYIFTVLNSLQGLFIFCFHCLLNKKVMKEYRRIFRIRKRKGTSSTSQSLVRKTSGSYEVTGRSHETNC